MKLGFIGMGNMAKALCKGFIASGKISPDEIYAYAPHREKLEKNAGELGFVPSSSVTELAESADMIFVACKPYQLESALTEAAPALAGRSLISVASGWTFDTYEELLKKLGLEGRVRIQCVMPNTPAMVGEGVFIVEEANSLNDDERSFLAELLSSLGLVHELPGHLMAIGSAVIGCSPAFVDMFMEAYADAAVKYGIPRSDAYRLISQTVLGAAKLQLETSEHPGALKDAVCSPSGTTIRGVQALEDHGLRSACMASIDAIMNR